MVGQLFADLNFDLRLEQSLMLGLISLAMVGAVCKTVWKRCI